jgi:hypothetical protein
MLRHIQIQPPQTAAPVLLIGATRTTYSRSRAGISLTALQRQAAAAQRAEAIESVMRLERSLLTLHLEDFPPAACPVLPDPARPNPTPYIDARQKQALQGISLFSWSKRKEAKQQARHAGLHDADVWWRQQRADQAERQAQLSEMWARLVAHDSDAVHTALEAAFEDTTNRRLRVSTLARRALCAMRRW